MGNCFLTTSKDGNTKDGQQVQLIPLKTGDNWMAAVIGRPINLPNTHPGATSSKLHAIGPTTNHKRQDQGRQHQTPNNHLNHRCSNKSNRPEDAAHSNTSSLQCFSVPPVLPRSPAVGTTRPRRSLRAALFRRPLSPPALRRPSREPC